MNVVPDLIAYGCTHFPDRAAVVTEERELTFTEVDQRANRLVALLRAHGVEAGDRVALIAANEPEFLEIQVACMRAGAIFVPINFRLAVPELSYIIGDMLPRVLICGADCADAAVQLDVRTRWVLGADYEAALQAQPGVSGQQPIAAEAASTILYTSGTTGRPKGAVISNHALFARINSNLFEYQVSSSDRFLQCLPLFHIASNVSSSYTFAGATNVYLKKFDPALALERIGSAQITAALMVPTMINAVINHPYVHDANLQSLRTLAYGASAIPPVVLEQAIELLGCGFLQLFGMTETSGCTILRRGDHLHKERLASAGMEALGFEVRIVDDADSEVSPGTVGEVICRGPAIMDHYWNAPEPTAEALRNGWMHTGDLGYRDPHGYVFVTDRKKDMIISGGENVYPREVEDVLFEHPEVLEAAVIGVPDERWGGRVHAVLVSNPGCELDPEQVLGFARSRLAAYKVPKSAELLAELPKNATGKVLKTVLREPWWQGRTRGVN
jgi:acyl-CoA synthetase (AMP-forming)/AMP-acid ligase II